MSQYEALLSPLTIKHLTLRNRVMSTSHAPRYNTDGTPSERYIRYHEEKAKGGIGLTMCGGSSSVSLDSPADLWGQLSFASDDIIAPMQKFSDRIHAQGSKLMAQITHLGRRTRWDVAHWFPTISSSPNREPAHRTFPKEMEDWDIQRVIQDYAKAAIRCREGGLDGLEFLADSQIFSQFWCPTVNQRKDKYGGSLQDRMTFSLEVLEAVRKAVGDDFIVGLRVSADTLYEGSLSHEECLEAILTHANTGMLDFLNITAGTAFTERMLAETVCPGMAFPAAPFLYLPSAVKQETNLPVFHATRITDLATATRAIEEGHVDMVAMTRGHMADPHIVKKLMEGRPDDIRQCVGAGYCISRIYVGNDALCIQNPATGREQTMPHVIDKAQAQRKVVVVGGGPGGLEAARVSAERGHDVVLFEKESQCGGQINLMIKSPSREGMSGVTRWLYSQVEKLGVDIRLNTTATADMVMAENPDVVIVATGGYPRTDIAKGSELAVSTWDILSGKVELGDSILLYDDQAEDNGVTCATFIAGRIADSDKMLEVVTPERRLATDVGESNYPIYLRELYKQDTVITPDLKLTEIYREDGKLIAVFKNGFSDKEEEHVCDQVIIEHGTLPLDELYFELKPNSRNLGQVDLLSLTRAELTLPVNNPQGEFELIRIGDAVSSRNIHAAMYDALRVCKEL